MEIREAEINRISNLDLIYIYSSDTIFNNSNNKYINIKIVFNKSETFSIDYKDKFFDTFIKRLFERYQLEKDKRKIILLGDLTKKLMNSFSFNFNEEKEEVIEQEFVLFKCIDKDKERYNAFVKEMIQLIIKNNYNYKDVVINDIKGHGTKYLVSYSVGNMNEEISFVLFKIDDEKLGFKLSDDIKGELLFRNAVLTINFKNYDSEGKMIYNSLNRSVIKEIEKVDQVLYYSDSVETVLDRDINKIKYYFELFDLEYSDNILKISDNAYMMSLKNEISGEDGILYSIKSYLININDDVMITEFDVNGISKYKDEINITLDKKVSEYITRKIVVDGKNYILLQKSFFDGSKKSFDYSCFDLDGTKNDEVTKNYLNRKRRNI